MTAYNPPSNIYFNGIGFNPTIIEQGNTVSTGGNATLAGNNTWTGTNNFNGSITMTTQAANNNSTLGATTAYVDNAISGVGGVSLSGNNVFTGTNEFTNGLIIDGLATISQNTTGTNPTFIHTSSTTGLNLIEFHSNSNFVTAYDSRILAYSGTSFDGEGFLQLEADTITLTSNTLSIDSISSFDYNATFNDGLTSSIIYCNIYDSFISGAALNIGNSYATSVEIARTGIATNILAALNVTGDTTLSGANTFSSTNDFTGGSINVITQMAGNSTTLAASTAFVTAAISALSSVYQTAAQVTTAITSYGYQTAAQVTTAISSAITSLKAASNSWTGANDFTGGSIVMTTQTAGDNSTFGASTAFVTAAISALSSVYQTSAQVSTAITSALTTFKATANTFSANQIFSTIQFSTGTLNQAFYIQHVNAYAFGAVAANTAVTQTFSYSTLGMTNYTTFITAQICNSSSSAQGNRVLFSIQAQSASSFTIVGYNVTATNTAASAFSLVVYGR